MFKHILVGSLLLSALPHASAAECKMDPKEIKTINRCASVRTHGGQVTGNEYLQFGGSSFWLWSAPQTFEKLYKFECTDSSGFQATLIGDVSFDCVGDQQIAAVGIDQAKELSDSQSTFQVRLEMWKVAMNQIDSFVKEKFRAGNKKPSDMPVPSSGIRYWDQE